MALWHNCLGFNEKGSSISRAAEYFLELTNQFVSTKLVPSWNDRGHPRFDKFYTNLRNMWRERMNEMISQNAGEDSSRKLSVQSGQPLKIRKLKRSSRGVNHWDAGQGCMSTVNDVTRVSPNKRNIKRARAASDDENDTFSVHNREQVEAGPLKEHSHKPGSDIAYRKRVAKVKGGRGKALLSQLSTSNDFLTGGSASSESESDQSLVQHNGQKRRAMRSMEGDAVTGSSYDAESLNDSQIVQQIFKRRSNPVVERSIVHSARAPSKSSNTSKSNRKLRIERPVHSNQSSVSKVVGVSSDGRKYPVVALENEMMLPNGLGK
jgi:hypothetical protein